MHRSLTPCPSCPRHVHASEPAPEPPVDPGPDDGGGLVALYGAPAPDPEADGGDTTTEPKPDDGDVAAPVYGAPPQPQH